MSQPQQDLVQRQFGANAERYVQSAVHAQGHSLALMVEMAAPRRDWLALDVAPGGGHSALAIAAHVQTVFAIDITANMLRAARRYARHVGQSNIVWVQGDGGQQPFAADTFDLITCRVALHHFVDAAAALRQWARVLKPSGRLVLVDNVGAEDAAAEAYVNQFEQLRDPSHVWMHPLPRLLSYVRRAGFEIARVERLLKPMKFVPWMERMQVDVPTQEQLTAMLWDSTGPARRFLNPQIVASETTFSLHEAVIAARLRPA
ncbi:MAG: methyltransferase domain-containing protein [Chloroflexi bacterium]|nr:methyltransferase domain-containing protein [Chloroflexota bacterium]